MVLSKQNKKTKLILVSGPAGAGRTTAIRSLEDLGFELIEVREKFSNKTLADLYDPDQMPLEIKNIHLKIDKYMERCNAISI